MDYIDFSKPTVMCDVILIVDNRKLYCNKAILSIWSPVFETMFKSNFKEKDSNEVSLPDKSYDDVYDLLQVIYPPNKAITILNVEKMLELADEYQMIGKADFWTFDRSYYGYAFFDSRAQQTLPSISYATARSVDQSQQPRLCSFESF